MYQIYKLLLNCDDKLRGIVEKVEMIERVLFNENNKYMFSGSI